MGNENEHQGMRVFVEQASERLLEEHLRRMMKGALGELSEQAQKINDDTAVERAVTQMKDVRALRKALHELIQRQEGASNTATYLTSTPFLVAAYRVLTRTRNEHLAYATGPEDGKRLFTLTRLVCFRLAERSVAHASPEPVSQIKALTELDEKGERLLATLHSHPGTGVNATSPSSVDLPTQNRLERAGYPTISAIFSRDGFVRFFSVDRRFTVNVSGTGNRKIGEQLFQLTDLSASNWFSRGGRDDSARRRVPRK